MKTKTTGALSLAVGLTTLVWSIMTFTEILSSETLSTLDEKIISLYEPGFFYFFMYVNAALITLLSVAMLAGFYHYCRDDAGPWPFIAIAFVPMYGLGNTVAYLTQVFVIPSLVLLHQAPATNEIAGILLGLMIHDWPGTAIEALNAVSYAILGIPQIIFGLIMYRKARGLRVGSILLAVSGGLSFMAVIGVAVNNTAMGMIAIPSGFIYMLSLILIGIHFIRRLSGQPRI